MNPTVVDAGASLREERLQERAAALAAPVGNSEERVHPGWDLRRGPRSYVAVVLLQGLSAGLSLVSMSLLARYLGAASYGGFVALLTAYQTVTQVGLGWCGVALTRFGCEEFVRTQRIRSALWTYAAVVGSLLGIVLLSAPLWAPIAIRSFKVPEPLAWFILPLVVGSALTSLAQLLAQAVKLPRLQVGLLALEKGLLMTLVVGLGISGRLRAEHAALASLVAAASAAGAGILAVRPFLGSFPGVKGLQLKSMARFALPLLPFALVGYFTGGLADALFVIRFLNKQALAVYYVSYQMFGVVLQLCTAAGTLALPFLITLVARERDEEIAVLTRHALPISALAWSAVCGVAALALSAIVPFVFGAAFSESRLLFWPLMTAAAFACPVVICLGPLTNATSNTHISFWLACVTAATNLLLDWLWIPSYGLVGGACATAVAYGAGCCFMLLWSRRTVYSARILTLVCCVPVAAGTLCFLVSRSTLWSALTVTACIFVTAMLWKSDFENSLKQLRHLARRMGETGLEPCVP